MSIQVDPARAVVSTPNSPSTTVRTAADDGRQVTTTSHRLANSAGDEAQIAPFANNDSALAR
jgi:hypothetical protein